MPANATGRLDALTGARFFAALLVLLFHFGGPLFDHAPGWAERVRAQGYVAVSFFFVLSGFILAFQYGRTAARGALDVRTFWVNRLARIYPVYLLGLLLLVPMLLVPAWEARAFGETSLRYRLVTFVSHLTLSQGWYPGLTPSWNLPGWSVCAEAFFYAVFPFAAAPLSRLSRRALTGVLVGAWLVSLALAGSYLLLDPDGLGAGSPHDKGFFLLALKFNPLVRLPEFLAGVSLGLLFVHPERRPGAGAAGGGVLAAGATAGLLAITAWGGVPYALLHTGALVPLFAALIWGLAEGGGVLGRVLSTRPLRALGEASYALYILQAPAMRWALALAGDDLDTAGAPFHVAWLLGMLGLSLYVTSAVERPLQQRVRRWLAPRPAMEGAVGRTGG